MQSSQDIHVIIRHVEERTKNLCHTRLAQQIPEQNISFVSATPFTATLHQAYSKGIEADKKWTFCIDADVIPAEDCIEKILSIADKLEGSAFEAQGLIYDKIFGVMRPAGNHLYRTSLFPDALKILENSPQHLRPETNILRTMARNHNHSWFQDSAFIGLHDFGQYYTDIIRKILLQYFKFPDARDSLVEAFEAKAQAGDTDFQVALEGIHYARTSMTEAFVDADFLNQHADTIFPRLQMGEKSGITDGEITELTSLLTKLKSYSLTDRDTKYIGYMGYMRD